MQSQEAKLQETACCDGETKEMLQKLVLTASFFGSEQRDGTTLSLDDKANYVHQLYHKSLPSFIFQYGFQIESHHIAHLNEINKDDEDAKYHLRCLLKEIKKRSVRISNRRFTAMTKLMSDTDYFSEEQMKQRDPLLYQQMVGVYLSQDEIGEQSRGLAQHRSNLSDFLFSQLDTDGSNAVYEQQRNRENMEEELANSDDDNSEAESDESELEDDEEDSTLPRVKQIKISDEEKQLLRDELLHTMQERFMSGKDVEFDYRTVDDNEMYDDLAVEELDDQERYFDSSDSENNPDNSASNTHGSYSHMAEDEYDY